MKYPIHNTKGEVLFEAEIDCEKRATDSHKKDWQFCGLSKMKKAWQGPLLAVPS